MVGTVPVAGPAGAAKARERAEKYVARAGLSGVVTRELRQ
jgi:hypothetical protein